VRVGIDLVRVEDIRRSLATFGDAYLHRVFTADEVAYARGSGASDDVTAERLAARFAAKESTLKVLGVDETGVGHRSIEVVRAPSGACSLVLHREAREAAQTGRVAELSLSMSHEAEYATAVVIARLEEPRFVPKRIHHRALPAPRRARVPTRGDT
jgi:holo-[acyl-carrier protein] synthase